MGHYRSELLTEAEKETDRLFQTIIDLRDVLDQLPLSELTVKEIRLLVKVLNDPVSSYDTDRKEVVKLAKKKGLI
jgi:hypothetical protein